MTSERFTGERLHEEDALFAVDLARHRAAYRFALEREPRVRTLDVGCGSGHGVALLAGEGVPVVGFDRELPDASSRRTEARFVVGDIGALPFERGSFERIVSFQVIEHLERPGRFVEDLSLVLHPDGELSITTPNRLTSDGLNPYHVREYTGAELAELLGESFGEVEMLGVGASERARPYYEQRLATLRRIERLDVLGLHRRLPRRLRLWLFARAAVVMRRFLRRQLIQRQGVAAPEIDERDFPIGPLESDALDLLAVCRCPRR